MDAKKKINFSKAQAARILVGITLLGIVGSVYVPHLFFTMSNNAVINARIITLTSPIEGFVKNGPPLMGTEFQKGDIVASVDNPIVDPSVLETLRTDYLSAQKEIQAIIQEKESLILLQSKLDLSDRQYRENIEKRLNFEILQTQAKKDQLSKAVEENKKDLDRKEKLLKKGDVAASVHDTSYYAYEKALKEMEQAKFQVDLLNVELNAIREGIIFNADGRAEVPYQKQRKDEVSIRVLMLETRLQELQTRLSSLKKRLDLEENRFSQLAHSDVLAPSYSVVWKTYTTPGSRIDGKAPLVELVDCSNVFIDMSIHERFFEKIKPGDRVRIQLTGSNEEIPGVVSSIRGGNVSPQSSQGTFASINPIKRAREIQIYITIDEQALSQSKGDFCNVGRNAKVYFETSRGFTNF